MSKRKASPAQLRALAKAQTARGNKKAATTLRHRAAMMEGGRKNPRRGTKASKRSYRRNPGPVNAARAKASAKQLRKAAGRAAVARALDLKAARELTSMATHSYARKPARRKKAKAAPRRKSSTTSTRRAAPRRRNKRRTQCIAVPVRRTAKGRFRNNPLDMFFDNPMSGMFADNPRRGRKRKSSTTSARRKKSHKRTSHRRRSMTHHRNNPVQTGFFADNPMMMSLLDTGIALGTAAIFFTLADMLDRYLATRAGAAKTPWYGADAATRILAKPDGIRMLTQFGIGGALLAGAYYLGGKHPKVGAVLGGAGGGVVMHGLYLALKGWVMPMLFKAGDGSQTDATLGNRLYPLEQLGSQNNLKAAIDAETAALASIPDVATQLFPWVIGTVTVDSSGAVTGAKTVTSNTSLPGEALQPVSGAFEGAQHRQLPPARPNMWPQAAAQAQEVGVAGCKGCQGKGQTMIGTSGNCGCDTCVAARGGQTGDYTWMQSSAGWTRNADGSWTTPQGMPWTGPQMPWMVGAPAIAASNLQGPGTRVVAVAGVGNGEVVDLPPEPSLDDLRPKPRARAERRAN